MASSELKYYIVTIPPATPASSLSEFGKSLDQQRYQMDGKVAFFETYEEALEKVDQLEKEGVSCWIRRKSDLTQTSLFNIFNT